MSNVNQERRFYCNVLLMLLCAALPLTPHSQIRPLTSISEITEHTFPKAFLFPTLLNFSDRRRSDIIAFDGKTSELFLLFGTGTGEFVGRKKIATIAPPTSVVVGNINNDGLDDIVIVHRESNKIQTFISNKIDSTYSSQSFSVNYYPEQAVIGDISGDNIPDIVVFGKLSDGVSVLRGKGGNKFHEKTSIFQSVPINGLSIINLNDDKIPDIVIRKWLTNEDIFYFGIGNLQFSEQTTLSYADDSALSQSIDLNGDNISDVVVASSQLNSLLVYRGDGLGSMVRVQDISLQENAATIFTTAIHSNRYKDIIVKGVSDRQISILINKNNGQFYDETVFGLPYDKNEISVADINGDGFNDLIVFNITAGKYMVVWNDQSSRKESKERKHLVGNSPSNIYVSDLNADGFDDICISNTGSNTVSIIMGSSHSSFSQFSVETANSPTSVTVYSKNDTSLTLVTVHSDESMIGLITLKILNEENTSAFGDVEFYTIPLSGKPSYVLPDQSVNNRSVSMYVFSKTIPNSISFYQQLQATKFVVKNMTLQIPSRILFSTISDLNNDGITDLVYIYNFNNKDIIGATLNDRNGDFSGNSFSYILPDTGMKRGFVYVEDLNGDQQKDFIIYDHTKQRLSTIQGKYGGEFSDLIHVTDQVSVNNVHQIQIIDFDADGIYDILYSDSGSNNIFFLKGKGNILFFPKQMVLEIPPGSVFRCGDFNGDGNIDIVYTIPKENSISFRYGK